MAHPSGHRGASLGLPLFLIGSLSVAVMVAPAAICEVQKGDTERCSQRWQSAQAFFQSVLFGGALAGTTALDPRRFTRGPLRDDKGRFLSDD